jgi:hypothetical protein
MRNLPISKRIAVAIAPAMTSRHASDVSGSFVNHREQQLDQTERDNKANNTDQELCAWKDAFRLLQTGIKPLVCCEVSGPHSGLSQMILPRT